jgi:hypothetical protein
MLILISFSSFFSSFDRMRSYGRVIESRLHEINEKYEESHIGEGGVISVNSFNSLHSFSFFFRDVAAVLLLCPGFISKSQPTVRGHALLRSPLPGWRGVAPLRTPKSQSHER